MGPQCWLSSVQWGQCLGWTRQELNPAETLVSFHGAVLLASIRVVLLSHTYLTEPPMTWHVLGSPCDGDAKRSMGTCGEGSSVTVVAPSLHTCWQQNRGWGCSSLDTMSF